MTRMDAERIIGNLRIGIPPVGHLERFTVGRQSEIARLLGDLRQDRASALLIKSNYGSGKSHLLRLLREKALGEGFAVSLVSRDAQNGVNFGKMDSMMGAILRELEVPGDRSEKGLGGTFDFLHAASERARVSGENSEYWRDVTDNWKWDYTEELGVAAALYRATCVGDRRAGSAGTGARLVLRTGELPNATTAIV